MSNTVRLAGIVAGISIAAVAAAGQDVRPANDVRATDSRRSIQAQPGTSSALAAVLTRSCGDCHSNTMVRRWYTRVPPFSTMMARAAQKGRRSVDFSEWTRYTPEQQLAFLVASCADARAGKMPMSSYLRFRGDARLSRADVETICSAAGPVMTAGADVSPRKTP